MNPGDEKKLKDLTDRLMAMSPEPPPFPEETVVTSSGNQTRSTSPFLVFAGAAAVVLLAIGIPFLFFDNEPPVAAPNTSTTSSTTTTIGETTTTTPGETTTTSDGQIPIAGDAIVYLAQSPENSFTGNPALVAFATPAFGPPETDLTLYALQLLAPVDVPIAAPEGFFTAIPEGVEIVSARVAGGAPNALIVEMSETFLDGSGIGLLGDFTMLNQLIYTATQDPDIDEVQFIVNNQPVTQFGTDGLDLSGSVNRETFRDELNLINVTQPVLFNSDGLPIVEGISNTFEATVFLQIVNNGSVDYTDFTTATCGSGCWGDFSFSLDTPALNEDSLIWVLSESAEDGQPQFVVVIPLSPTGTWDFSGGITN